MDEMELVKEFCWPIWPRAASIAAYGIAILTGLIIF